MFRYVAALWNPLIESQQAVANALGARMCAAADEWRVVFARPGVAVYCAGLDAGSSRVYRFSNNSGVLLGRIFSHGESAAALHPTAFDEAETSQALRTLGRSIVDRYWGRYVAFLVDPCQPTTLVWRSPTGEIDALSTDIRGLRLYFSGTEHFPLTSLRNFSINWNYVASELATLLSETRETGLVEVERVLRGECIVHEERRTGRTFLWNPVDIARKEPICDPQFAASELRRVASESLNAWASCYRNILALLSGGLDSSIVVGLLRNTPSQPNVTCVNYRNPYDHTSDERRFARKVAQSAGYRLIEHEQSADFSLEAILNMPQTSTPLLNAYGVGDVQQREEIARSHGGQAWFLGHGGDEVFFKPAPFYQSADFVYRYGLRPGLFGVALDAARMTQTSLWTILRSGIREGRGNSGLPFAIRDYQSHLPLLAPDALDSVQKARLFVPHWLQQASDIPPGKCKQIIALSGPDAMYDPYASDAAPEIVNPIKSQPMQELCLRISTHVLAHGARTRGLAKRAFADILPIDIARREGKGSVRVYMKAIWARNKTLIGDLLHDGLLIQNGIIDKAKLESTLTESFAADYTELSRITVLFCAEAWARRWATTGSLPSHSSSSLATV